MTFTSAMVALPRDNDALSGNNDALPRDNDTLSGNKVALSGNKVALLHTILFGKAEPLATVI